MYRLLQSKLYICCSEIETKIKAGSMEGSDEDEMGIIFLKSDINVPF